MLTTVDFCGLKVTRLILGANPFGGFSHQSPERDKAMIAFNTGERIKETWQRAHAAGINTMITNNETPHVIQAVREYLAAGGPLQWIAQMASRNHASMLDAVDEAVAIGAKAMYFHGGLTDDCFARQDDKTLRSWVERARSHKVPVGVAAHVPAAHDWVDSLKLVDFHVVCFFNCGSVHAKAGHRFRLGDAYRAVECIRRLQKPCIGYKIMGAGRIDAAMAFEFAFDNIKPTDVVNVGMHRGDKDNMVEEDVALVQRMLTTA